MHNLTWVKIKNEVGDMGEVSINSDQSFALKWEKEHKKEDSQLSNKSEEAFLLN